MTVGTKRFITWFETKFYNKERNACKNIFIKIFIHSLGVLFMMDGLYFLLTTIPSLTSITGVFLSVLGLLLFVIPLGVD